MIGPVTPNLPQANTSGQAANAVPLAPAERPGDTPRLGTAVVTRRPVRPIPEGLDLRGLEGAIAAQQNKIFQAENAAARDRERLDRYPVELAGLKAQFGTATEDGQRAEIRQRINQLEGAFTAVQTRLAQHDTHWPEKKAMLSHQIEVQQRQLAEAGYQQVPD